MGSEEQRVPVRLVRPRTLLYAALIALVMRIMAAAFAMRADVEINLMEDRNPLFVRLSDGGMRNGYTLKILNKTHEPRGSSSGWTASPRPACLSSASTAASCPSMRTACGP